VSDYLFDKSGTPDPEVERLEQLLAPMAYRGAPPRPPRRTPAVWIAASVLAAAAVILLLVRPWKPATPSWAAVASGAGVSVDNRAVAGELRVPVGGWIDTGSGQLALEVTRIGHVELAPSTRARIVATGAQDRVRLERGTASARITAPPRRFAIETPHAVITDLGCAFEVTVDENGIEHVKVTEGRVGVAQNDGPETEIAAGAEWPVQHTTAHPERSAEGAESKGPVPVRDSVHVKHPHHPVKHPTLPPHVPTAPPATPKPAPATKKADDRFSHDPWKNQTP
jgi:ferric-dicitrate binding protein FerR (iron transport regulator)